MRIVINEAGRIIGQADDLTLRKDENVVVISAIWRRSSTSPRALGACATSGPGDRRRHIWWSAPRKCGHRATSHDRRGPGRRSWSAGREHYLFAVSRTLASTSQI